MTKGTPDEYSEYDKLNILLQNQDINKYCNETVNVFYHNLMQINNKLNSDSVIDNSELRDIINSQNELLRKFKNDIVEYFKSIDILKYINTEFIKSIDVNYILDLCDCENKYVSEIIFQIAVFSKLTFYSKGEHIDENIFGEIEYFLRRQGLINRIYLIYPDCTNMTFHDYVYDCVKNTIIGKKYENICDDIHTCIMKKVNKIFTSTVNNTSTDDVENIECLLEILIDYTINDSSHYYNVAYIVLKFANDVNYFVHYINKVLRYFKDKYPNNNTCAYNFFKNMVHIIKNANNQNEFIIYNYIIIFFEQFDITQLLDLLVLIEVDKTPFSDKSYYFTLYKKTISIIKKYTNETNVRVLDILVPKTNIPYFDQILNNIFLSDNVKYFDIIVANYHNTIITDYKENIKVLIKNNRIPNILNAYQNYFKKFNILDKKLIDYITNFFTYQNFIADQQI